MLLPRLYTQAEYLHHAEDAGLEVFSPSMDISDQVSKTWYVTNTEFRVRPCLSWLILGIFHGL